MKRGCSYVLQLSNTLHRQARNASDRRTITAPEPSIQVHRLDDNIILEIFTGEQPELP